jgi:RNA polymerase sigma-70 factor (ECF subfamily)
MGATALAFDRFDCRHAGSPRALDADPAAPAEPLARPRIVSDVAPAPLTFESVYDRWFDFVWRSVRRLGVPEASVDDAVQDVFVVVHRRLADFEGRSTVKTWLFGIAMRVAKDHRRAASRRRPTEPLRESLVDAPCGCPMENAAQNEAVRLFHELLDTLDDEKRAVFVMAELEQMSAPEIAGALDVNLNTVYSRLRAARAGFERAVARHRAHEKGAA